MSTITSEHFTQALCELLDEAFDEVHGHFLDPGNSLFTTLQGISAEEASIPVGGKCATLAAQVKHVAFYLDVMVKEVEDPTFNRPGGVYPDWGEIWRTVQAVSSQEWQEIQSELRTSYARIKTLIDQAFSWESTEQIAVGMAVVAHTAYHLGEIRQALCTLK
jgi:hypothetical protein